MAVNFNHLIFVSSSISLMSIGSESYNTYKFSCYREKAKQGLDFRAEDK